MKKKIKEILLNLRIILNLPLLLPFWLTNEKEIILADVQRWIEVLDLKKKPEIISLLTLVSQAKEFRNLYYYRILQGNISANIFLCMLQVIYKSCPDLFIDSASKIGPGLFIQHGFSTIITADMGENCWVNQQVTIGFKDKTGHPKIGNNVKITAGAKVIGNITIGNNVTVGANAVVVKNIPDNCVVVGVPAYIVKRNGVKVREELV